MSGHWHHYEPDLQAEAELVRTRLQKVFSGLTCKVLTSKEVPFAALDSAKGQYDVHFLLNLLTLPQYCNRVIWIVAQDIGDFWHFYLFGAAKGNRAIVSNARLKAADLLAKEACHEAGHMLGLSHCQNDCCMQKSWTTEAVRKKSAFLCASCRNSLNLESIPHL